MIIGVGIDLVSVPRMERALARWGGSFLSRVFSEEELAQAGGRPRSLAARFAAKEAFSKALGTGLGARLGLRDVWVVKDERGRPELAFSPKAARLLRERGGLRAHLSLTHEGEYAGAVVVIEGAG